MLLQINGNGVGGDGQDEENSGENLRVAHQLGLRGAVAVFAEISILAAQCGDAALFAPLKQDRDGDENTGKNKKNTSDYFKRSHYLTSKQQDSFTIIAQSSVVCKGILLRSWKKNGEISLV
jgi:hypothetical protein